MKLLVKILEVIVIDHADWSSILSGGHDG